MIDFKSKLGKFRIPSSFSDVTIEDLEYYKENIDNPIKVFERLTKLEAVKLAQLDIDSLVDYLGFLKEDILESIEPSDTLIMIMEHTFIKRNLFKKNEEITNVYKYPFILPEEVAACQWGQKLLALNAIREGDILDVLAIYLQPEYDKTDFNDERIDAIKEVIKKQSVDSVYSCIKYLTDQLKAIAEKDGKFLKPEITHEQRAAGIGMFNALGDFNSIDMVAQGDPTKYEEVLKIDYNTIFNKLYHIKLSAKFDKRYNEILNPKKARK